MRTDEYKPTWGSGSGFCGCGKALSLLIAACAANPCARAQTAGSEILAQQIQTLTEAMERVQAQMEQSQRELEAMRAQLSKLQRQIAQNEASAADASTSSATAAVEELRERQAMDETQIATQEQTKVESESRYPVKITGLLLLNSFVNTGEVDMPATPTVALPGAGSTGASVRQSILGLDAQGPHLFGARSYANLRVDFYGSGGSSSIGNPYSGYYNSTAALLRLRTAHAGLRWGNTEAYFALDRPIFSPDTPTSLTAVAIPALGWSGNLWTWNPQLGVNRDINLLHGGALRLQAALVDVGDAPLTPVQVGEAATPPNGAEQSRWPGIETHFALLGRRLTEDRPYNHFGIGGYFAPHFSTLIGHGFDAWAATLDAGVVLPGRFQFTGGSYRGLALGGLGGGAYKDFAVAVDTDLTGYYFRPLDDVGGWAQLKEKFSERIEANAAFGIDDVFASELRGYALPSNTFYQNLDRSRTYTGNLIYSPSAYLLFSLEYRHLESTPVTGSSAASNILGLGAGYKF